MRLCEHGVNDSCGLRYLDRGLDVTNPCQDRSLDPDRAVEQVLHPLQEDADAPGYLVALDSRHHLVDEEVTVVDVDDGHLLSPTVDPYRHASSSFASTFATAHATCSA